jgi:hypothetical protein
MIEKRVCKNEEILETSVDDGLGMMNLETGKYYTLNHIGMKVWGLMKEEIPIKQLVGLLQHQYDASVEEIENDVLEYIRLLSSQGLVRILD